MLPHNNPSSSASDSRDSTTSSSDENHARRRDISIVQPPSQNAAHPLLHSLPNDTLLPLELLDALNQTYFLHLLVNHPEKVLPPGKSLLSVMLKPERAREKTEGELPTIQEKVEEVVHRAFWDEVRLSSLMSSYICFRFWLTELLGLLTGSLTLPVLSVVDICPSLISFDVNAIFVWYNAHVKTFSAN